MALAALTIAAALQIVDRSTGRLLIKFDPSENGLLQDEFYEKMRGLYGNDETIIIAVHVDDVFTVDSLERIKRLTEKLEGEERLGLASVVSLTNARGLLASADEIPEDPAALRELRERALANPL